MRVKHVMNTQIAGLDQSEGAARSGAAPPENNAGSPAASMDKLQRNALEFDDMDTEDPGTPALFVNEESSDVPESPWTGRESPGRLQQIIQESYNTLLHRPEKWYTLNKRLNTKGGRDVLFGIEDVIKEKSPATVRQEFSKIKPQINADLIGSLHQPLLSLMVFILRESNDIHKKLIRVPDLKSDICRAMELGRPSKKPAPTPKPKLERTVKKLKGPLDGRKKLKKKSILSIGLKKRDTDNGSMDTDEALIKRGPGRPKVAKARAETDGPPVKKLKKLKAGDKVSIKTVHGSKTLHQLIASSQERDRSGKFAPGFSPKAAVKLKSVIKKPVTITPPKKKLKLSVDPKPPKEKQSASKRGRPAAARPVAAPSPEPEDSDFAYEPRDTDQDSFEDATIAALVHSLRARGARDARGREELALLELDEKISDLEVSQRQGQAELSKLRTRRTVLLGERLGAAGEPDVSEPVKAARERCLRSIVDLLDVLSASLDLNAVDCFNELERTDSFDATLGALAGKQRAYLQRDWDRKNALAAQAKRAELEAMRLKSNVRQHLGILAASGADEVAECNAVFSAFQIKLIELRRDMELTVGLLVEKENLAKQSWLVYRAAV